MDGVKTKARFAGLFSLLTVLAGVFAQGYVSRSLIDYGDAAATAGNILGHPDLLQLGFAVYMVEMACQIARIALFYELLRPVDRGVNAVATFLALAGAVIKAASRILFVAPLLVLAGGTYLSAFSAPQLQALSLVLLRINDRGAGTATIFFGLSTPLVGYLMFRSGFLPKFLGVIEVVCGVGWVTFLYPPLYYRLFPLIVGLALLGSMIVIVWLLVFGVDEERWRRQAALEAH